MQPLVSAMKLHKAQPQKVHLKAGDLPLAMHPAMPGPLTGLFPCDQSDSEFPQACTIPLASASIRQHVPGFTFQSSGGTPSKARNFGLCFADKHDEHLLAGRLDWEEYDPELVVPPAPL